MRAYSVDLRHRIVTAVRSGATRQAVADRFHVALRTVDRYLARARASDSLAARPIPGRPRRLPPDTDSLLVAHLEAHPAATLAEHCRLWHAVTGVDVSVATMSRAIARVGWSRKKGRWQRANATLPRGRPGGTR